MVPWAQQDGPGPLLAAASLLSHRLVGGARLLSAGTRHLLPRPRDIH